jgi:hypothetical protein
MERRAADQDTARHRPRQNASGAFFGRALARTDSLGRGLSEAKRRNASPVNRTPGV